MPPKLWTFSAHAESRCASRFNLLVDAKAKAEISRQLDNGATRVTIQHGRSLFEVMLYGIRTIAVCDVPKRTVVTLIEAKRWYRRINLMTRRGRNLRPKPGWKDVDEEE